MRIVKYKGCKKCGGDLYLEQDYQGAYLACLQCSAIYNLPDIPPKPKPAHVRLPVRR